MELLKLEQQCCGMKPTYHVLGEAKKKIGEVCIEFSKQAFLAKLIPFADGDATKKMKLSGMGSMDGSMEFGLFGEVGGMIKSLAGKKWKEATFMNANQEPVGAIARTAPGYFHLIWKGEEFDAVQIFRGEQGATHTIKQNGVTVAMIVQPNVIYDNHEQYFMAYDTEKGKEVGLQLLLYSELARGGNKGTFSKGKMVRITKSIGKINNDFDLGYWSQMVAKMQSLGIQDFEDK